MKQVLFIPALLSVFCSFAQQKAYLLSEKHLASEAKKHKIQLKTFSELPQAVRDTIEGTFAWYERYVQEHPDDYLASYSNMISLDTALKFENFRANESYEKAVTSATYNTGQFFTIGGREFRVPVESQIILKITYQDKLFLMGGPLTEDKKFVKAGNRLIITTDNANHAYWIIPLK